MPRVGAGTCPRALPRPAQSCLTRLAFESGPDFDPARRRVGADWPKDAETMIGLERLENVDACVRDVLTRGRARRPDRDRRLARRRGRSSCAGARRPRRPRRTVWVADSFQGLPRAGRRALPVRRGRRLRARHRGSLDPARGGRSATSARYGLLDEQVRFLPGWFRDTLPSAPVERLALLRLDGDLYESTIVALESLYPKLSPGGFAIVDDYGVPACREAVDDFRARHGIDRAARRDRLDRRLLAPRGLTLRLPELVRLRTEALAQRRIINSSYFPWVSWSGD